MSEVIRGSDRPLACEDCGAVHDVDLGPDEGECIVCGGLLVEPGESGAEIRDAQVQNVKASIAESVARQRAAGEVVIYPTLERRRRRPGN